MDRRGWKEAGSSLEDGEGRLQGSSPLGSRDYEGNFPEITWMSQRHHQISWEGSSPVHHLCHHVGREKLPQMMAANRNPKPFLLSYRAPAPLESLGSLMLGKSSQNIKLSH